MNEAMRFFVSVDEADTRIDKLLSEILSKYSRSYIQSLIKDKKIFVNGKVVKPSYIVKENDELCIDEIKDKTLDVTAENIPIDILYEDSDILIVNKDKGMVVHPSVGHYSGTLVNAVLYHCKDLSNINGVLRPGIVHRIDKNTTGTLVICKNNNSHTIISGQLKEHSINRRYVAIAKGIFDKKEGRVDLPIGRDENNRLKMAINYKNGKNAVTNYRVLSELNGASLVEFCLETGRTHQIRVHMNSMGHTLLGDSLYGEKSFTKETQEQCLHARLLGFIHPTFNVYVEYKARIPDYMERLYKKLGGEYTIEQILEND